MELKTCKNCRRLYNHFMGPNLCPTCVVEVDEIYREVKSYVYDHPNVSIQEVAEEFNISVKMIHSWIREERLEFGSNSTVGLPCEACGVVIKSGRFCNECKKSLVDNLSSAYKSNPTMDKQEKTKSNTKMRFFK